MQTIEQIAVGSEVIRKSEPKAQHSDEPLVGVVVAVRGDRARVRWSGAVRYAGGRRGDNTTSVKLSGLLEKTDENMERARKRLRGRRDRYYADRAAGYEELAAAQEARGEESAAEWSRREAEKYRRAIREAA